MEKKRLTRSNNRMIGGVCAGIADYFNWDITLVRIVYVLATFFTAFSGGIVYLILWLIMPEAGRENDWDEKTHAYKRMESFTFVYVSFLF